MKVGLPRQRHRQRRGSSFPVALVAQTAQRRVKFSQVVRMEINGEGRRACGWVSAQHSTRFKIALGQVDLQLAHLDGTVVLRIRGVDCACRGHLAGGSLPRRTEAELRVYREGIDVAMRPDGNGGAIQASVEAQAPVRLGADHVEHCVERNILETGSHFAVDGDDPGWGANESIAIG